MLGSAGFLLVLFVLSVKIETGNKPLAECLPLMCTGWDRSGVTGPGVDVCSANWTRVISVVQLCGLVLVLPFFG